MDRRAVVLQVQDREATVLLEGGEIRQIPVRQSGLAPGQEIFVPDREAWGWRPLAAAAALALVLVGAGLWTWNHTASPLAAEVSVDINPSFQLGLSAANQVLWVHPLDRAARRLVGQVPVDGDGISTAVADLTDAAAAAGYLSGPDKVVLVAGARTGNAPIQFNLSRALQLTVRQLRRQAAVTPALKSAEVLLMPTASQADITGAARAKLSLGRFLLAQLVKVTPEQARSQSISKLLSHWPPTPPSKKPPHSRGGEPAKHPSQAQQHPKLGGGAATPPAGGTSPSRGQTALGHTHPRAGNGRRHRQGPTHAQTHQGQAEAKPLSVTGTLVAATASSVTVNGQVYALAPTWIILGPHSGETATLTTLLGWAGRRVHLAGDNGEVLTIRVLGAPVSAHSGASSGQQPARRGTVKGGSPGAEHQPSESASHQHGNSSGSQKPSGKSHQNGGGSHPANGGGQSQGSEPQHKPTKSRHAGAGESQGQGSSRQHQATSHESGPSGQPGQSQAEQGSHQHQGQSSRSHETEGHQGSSHAQPGVGNQGAGSSSGDQQGQGASHDHGSGHHQHSGDRGDHGNGQSQHPGDQGGRGKDHGQSQTKQSGHVVGLLSAVGPDTITVGGQTYLLAPGVSLVVQGQASSATLVALLQLVSHRVQLTIQGGSVTQIRLLGGAHGGPPPNQPPSAPGLQNLVQ